MLGEQVEQLAQRALAPAAKVMRVLDRPELVVGDAQQERAVVLAGERQRPVEQRHEAGEVLDDLEAGDDALAGARKQGRADALEVRGRAQIARERRRGRDPQLGDRGGDALLVEVDQHRALRAPARRAPRRPRSRCRNRDPPSRLSSRSAGAAVL